MDLYSGVNWSLLSDFAFPPATSRTAQVGAFYTLGKMQGTPEGRGFPSLRLETESWKKVPLTPYFTYLISTNAWMPRPLIVSNSGRPTSPIPENQCPRAYTYRQVTHISTSGM